MNIDIQWFQINQDKTDLENVLSFIEKLPGNISLIFNAEVSNFIEYHIQKDEKNGVTPKLFLLSFNEAKAELERALLQKRRDIKIDSIINKRESLYKDVDTLIKIGFTENSLVLKAAVLNKLWSNTIETVNQGIIDFSKNKTVKLLRKFLQYLNSILGSLKYFIPAISGIKEIKDIVESYLNVAEELK